jgi:hypothetical protein
MNNTWTEIKRKIIKEDYHSDYPYIDFDITRTYEIVEKNDDTGVTRTVTKIETT